MNLFEFGNIGGGWWALLAIPITLLYILRIRMRRQQVATLLFWDQLFDEKKPRSWWQRLRHLLSLLLQLAFLLLIVAALVDPLWSWQKRQQRRIVLIVDNSASMQAKREDGTTRLDHAKQSTSALVRSMRGGDRMAILSAGGRPHVEIGMTDHQRSLLSAVESLPATDGPTDVESAVTVAHRLLAGQQQEGEIIVISDGCFENIERLQSDPSVTLYGVDGPRDNVGITRYQVRRSLLDAVGYQVLVDVTNFSEDERSCRIELNLEDELVDVLPLTLAPGETVTRIVDHTSAVGGRLIATLNVDDALATDNRAIAVLPKRTPIPVVLVTDGNVFLTSVLESIPLVDLRIVSQPPEAALPRGILVLDRQVPAVLPEGRVMVIDPQSSCDVWTLGGTISQPIVATVDTDSPLTQHVRLDNVLFPDAQRLEFTMDHEPLIQDPLDETLLARLRRPGGDIVVLTCSLEKGDLPLRIAFPVLMKNAIEWFQGHSGDLRPSVSSGKLVTIDIPASLQTGEPTDANRSDPSSPDENGTTDETDENDATDGTLAVVEQATTEVRRDLVLISPSRKIIPIATVNQQVTIGPLLETGLWTIRPAADVVTDERRSEEVSLPYDGRPRPSNRTATDGDVHRTGTDGDVHRTGTTLSAARQNGQTPGEPADVIFEDSSTIRIACNLSDAAESDLRPRAELTDIASLRLLTLGGRSLWFYLTLAAACLIVTEWWLYQRRIVG